MADTALALPVRHSFFVLASAHVAAASDILKIGSSLGIDL
jgi:hypothetical protein